MTDFADVWDDIVTRIGQLLPNHRRLPDAYAVEANDDLYLGLGWSLAISPGTNPERWLSKHKSIIVDLDLRITRKSFGLDHNPADKQDAEIDLFGDFELVYDDVHNNNLNAAGAIIKVLSFTGIEAVDTDRENFRVLTATLTVEYFRT